MSARPGPIFSSGHSTDRTSIRATLLTALLVFAIAYLVRPILLPFVLAAVIAYVCEPSVGWVSNLTRLPRIVPAIGAFLLLLGLAGFIGLFGLPPLLRQLTRSLGQVDGAIEGLLRVIIGNETIHFLGQSFDAQAMARAASAGLRDWIEHTQPLFSMAAFGLVGFFNLVLTVVLLFYFLVDGRRIARAVFWLIPPALRPTAGEIWLQLDPILKRYFVGITLVVAYAASVAYLGLGLVLGLKHALLLAVMTGVLELIPVIGPGTAAILAGLVAIQQATQPAPILAYAIYATALRVSIDHIVGPVVLGQASRLHPTLVIFCFLSGGLLFGISGVILGVPVALAVKVALTILYDKPSSTDAARVG